jgi:hypothetical protein
LVPAGQVFGDVPLLTVGVVPVVKFAVPENGGMVTILPPPASCNVAIVMVAAVSSPAAGLALTLVVVTWPRTVAGELGEVVDSGTIGILPIALPTGTLSVTVAL